MAVLIHRDQIHKQHSHFNLHITTMKSERAAIITAMLQKLIGKAAK